MFLSAFSWLVLAPAAQAGACPAVSTAAEVDAHLAAAEADYWGLNQAGFEADASAAQRALTCLGTPVTLELAARLHRVEGLRAWLRHDADATGRAFTVAKHLDLGYQFPRELPVEAPERSVYERVAGDAPRTVPVPAPTAGNYYFDAQAGPNRPQDRPTVFQHLDREDRPLATAYLGVADPLPVAAPKEPERPAKPPHRPVGQWIAGAASLGVLGAGVGVYGTGLWGYDQAEYRDLANTNPEAADAYYRSELFPRFALGIGLAAVGGAGLAGTSVWMITTPEAGTAGVSGRW